MLRAFFFLFLLSSTLFSITPEAVKVYRPISLYGTASSADLSEDIVQAKVESFFTVITGAMPEDLIHSIKSPTLLPSVGDGYAETECNLIVLSGLDFNTELEEEGGYRLTLNTANIQFPENIDVNLQQLLELTIDSLRRTLNNYYLDSLSQIEVEIKIVGLTEKQLYLQELETSYTFGIGH